MGKEDLIKRLKRILDPEQNLDLDFLLKLDVKELEVLLAILRERLER